MKTIEYSISEADAVRHLIVCDTQFTWAGVTNLTMPQMMDLQVRGWVVEGDDNDEFQLTEAGEAVVARALQHGVPKTLADVQPGGRVRLGDQAELDRHEFQAWARELLPCPFCGNSAEFVPYKDNGLTLKCKSMGCIQRNQRTLRYGIDWLRTSMAEHWNTRALSAQPSPGGQGDARRQWLEIRGLAAAIVKNLQAFADSPHKAAWCGALDDSLLFADQIEKAAAAAYEADLERRRMA